MYGSDVCSIDFVYPLGFYLDSLLHQFKISEEVYAKVCNTNAKKLLGL
jgi:predicted TIM-barrel fold metal-dependent hydrolase